MFGKKSKESSKPRINRFLSRFRFSTKITPGPSGFRAELDADSQDDRSPGSSQIAFCERESGAQGPPVSEASTFAVAIDDVVPGNLPQKEDNAHSREEREPGVVSRVPEQDHWDPEPGPSVVLSGVLEQATGGFGPLKALLTAIILVYANHKESVAVANKVEVLLSPIASLDALFATPPENVYELRRRDELIRVVEDIEGRLRSLYGKPEFQQHSLDHVQGGEDLFRFLEDLQETIFRYQMARQTAIDDHGHNSMNLVEAAVLNGIRCAQEVEYRHSDRNGCLKGTRGTILDEIELWTRDFGKPSVYWLNGLAGTGKTTIAQTIAERMFAQGHLGASFFCSRDFEDRSNLKFIFPSLAVQLARRYSEFRSIFLPLVQLDPEIIKESLYGQMNKLIVQPLAKSAVSTVIVIDALDECKDDEPASAILSVLAQFVSQITNVKFFVTGRPERRILEGFRLPLLAEATDVFVLHGIKPSQVNNDIRLFFRHSFSELKGPRLGLDGWPTDEQLDLLCERAEGLFVHAMATIKFIGQKNSNPKKQLDRLLQSPGSNAFGGKTKLRTGTTLDSLYASILQEAFGDDDPEGDPTVRSVLGAVVLSANPLAPSAITTLLNLDAEDIFPLLLSVHSLLILQEDVNRPVRPFHKSFPDFIVDPVRCPNPRFRVHPPDQHTELLVGCLELMNQRLKKNICELPDGVCNSEVEDLRERTELHIGQALQYSCRSWHKHLVDVTPTQALKIIPVLHQFLEEKFLFWLEVLSVLGTARVAIDALEATIKLLNASPTLNIVRDYLRFVFTFFEVIDTSAPHIYHSALPLSPRTSIIRELYAEQYARPFARVVRGLPVSWEPAIATMYLDNYQKGVGAWSPDNRLFAVGSYNSIQSLDAVTLKTLSTFEPCLDYGPLQQLCFSPDGHLLTGLFKRGLMIWDLQTGGLVGAGPQKELVAYSLYPPTYSIDGKLLAAIYENPESDTRFIVTYDLPSRTRIYSFRVSDGRPVGPVWTHGERLRFATMKPGSITIWEAEFTFTSPPAEVESMSAPNGISYQELFNPALYRLAFYTKETISIWDARESKLVLKIISGEYFDEMTFSSDGRFFACLTTDQGVSIWKASPAGYVLHNKLIYAIEGDTYLFLSPNGESIVTANKSVIRLWSTNDSVLPLPSVRGDFIIEFSPDATLAAVLRRRETTVEILNLKSGNPKLIIDAGMEVLSVVVTGSVVAVVDLERVITWNLPAGDFPLNSRANINDSVQTILFSHQESYHGLLEYADVVMSPKLTYVAVIIPGLVVIYDGSTGEHLTKSDLYAVNPKLRFTPDECDVWLRDFIHDSDQVGYKIVEDRVSDTTKLDRLEPTAYKFGTFPWESVRGYEVTREGWALSPTKKRLLWLPNHWRSDERLRTWSGKFLGLRDWKLPEAVILEFLE